MTLVAWFVRLVTVTACCGVARCPNTVRVPLVLPMLVEFDCGYEEPLVIVWARVEFSCEGSMRPAIITA